MTHDSCSQTGAVCSQCVVPAAHDVSFLYPTNNPANVYGMFLHIYILVFCNTKTVSEISCKSFDMMRAAAIACLILINL